MIKNLKPVIEVVTEAVGIDRKLHGIVVFTEDFNDSLHVEPIVRIPPGEDQLGYTVAAIRLYATNLMNAADDMVKSSLPKN